MGDTGRQLAESRHLLRMDQAGLCGLQFAECCFRRIAGPADLFLGTLPLGDIAKDQDAPAAWDRIAPDLDDSAVRPGAIKARLVLRDCDTTADFRFDLGRGCAVFAALPPCIGNSPVASAPCRRIR